MDGFRSLGVRRLELVVAAAALVIGLQLVGIRPALAAETCSINASTHAAIVSLASDAQQPQTVYVSQDGGAIMIGPIGHAQACGTVTTLDTMTIDMANTQDLLAFSTFDGAFAPGFTPEADGTSEIEFSVTHAGHAGWIGVNGSPEADTITAGIDRLPFPALETIQVINLNAGAEGSAPDNDIAVHGLSSTGSLLVITGDGADHVLANGTGAGTGAGPLNVPIQVQDGTGADVVVGGNGDDAFQPPQAKDAPDSYSGGPGKDLLFMPFRQEGMSISLDGIANDGIDCPGASCEGDNVDTDIEAVVSGDGDDTLKGGPGPQELAPGGGTNTVFGGGGDDLITINSFEADTVHGGSGFDAVSYQGHTSPQMPQPVGVFVTLDGEADDGFQSEGDNIEPDVEAIHGSPFDDEIVGSDANNSLFGGGGNDVLVGGAGDDLLDGGGTLPPDNTNPRDGNDTMLGGAGIDTVVEDGHSGGMTLSIDGLPNDIVTGNPGQGRDNIYTDVENVVGGPFDDVITGNDAANRLEGGGGNDVLRGLGGPDTLLGEGGNDTLNGGPGKDSCSQGPGTGTVTGCES